MPIKKIVMGFAAFSFLLFSHVARSQYTENVSYQDLSPQQQHEIDASFVESNPAPHYDYHSNNSHKPKIKTQHYTTEEYSPSKEYNDLLPNKIATTEKVIVVDPNLHEWGAYSAEGTLLRSGVATAGARWCNDIDRPCKTKTGVFRLYSLGNSECVSSKYPVGEGGAPMPYCMYFNGSQGLHGSNQVIRGNISHGCVRVSVGDAEWLRFNFSDVGTKVIIKQY